VTPGTAKAPHDRLKMPILSMANSADQQQKMADGFVDKVKGGADLPLG